MFARPGSQEAFVATSARQSAIGPITGFGTYSNVATHAQDRLSTCAPACVGTHRSHVAACHTPMASRHPGPGSHQAACMYSASNTWLLTPPSPCQSLAVPAGCSRTLWNSGRQWFCPASGVTHTTPACCMSVASAGNRKAPQVDSSHTCLQGGCSHTCMSKDMPWSVSVMPSQRVS
jgi:hypothetical protein